MQYSRGDIVSSRGTVAVAIYAHTGYPVGGPLDNPRSYAPESNHQPAWKILGSDPIVNANNGLRGTTINLANLSLLPSIAFVDGCSNESGSDSGETTTCTLNNIPIGSVALLSFVNGGIAGDGTFTVSDNGTAMPQGTKYNAVDGNGNGKDYYLITSPNEVAGAHTYTVTYNGGLVNGNQVFFPRLTVAVYSGVTAASPVAGTLHSSPAVAGDGTVTCSVITPTASGQFVAAFLDNVQGSLTSPNLTIPAGKYSGESVWGSGHSIGTAAFAATFAGGSQSTLTHCEEVLLQ